VDVEQKCVCAFDIKVVLREDRRSVTLKRYVRTNLYNSNGLTRKGKGLTRKPVNVQILYIRDNGGIQKFKIGVIISSGTML
jgi:hypothetical protein